MKIGFFGLTPNKNQQILSDNLSGHQLIFNKNSLNEENIPDETDFEVIGVFVDCAVTQKVIDRFPNLKLITTSSTGFDHIDYEYAKSKGIRVANVPTYGSNTVAEFTFGLILALSRKIPQAVIRTKQQGEYDYRNLCGFDLFGKTLGVIGTGKIGKNVIRIATGFGMKVLGYDAFPDQTFAQMSGFEYVTLEKLLQSSDIITIHTPYNDQTHHLINKDNITLIRKESFLINTARGAIIETDSLYEALKDGRIKGAALDVLEEEGNLKNEEELLLRDNLPVEKFRVELENKALMDLPQVIVTPHMAFYTLEAENSILETTIKNIQTFIQGNPENIVNS